jgi:hypothetical protein
MAGLSCLSLLVVLDAVTRLLRLAVRSSLLMRRVRMILGLEVFRLVWGTFAIPGHEFSKVESDLYIITLPLLSMGALIDRHLALRVRRQCPRSGAAGFQTRLMKSRL